MFGPQEQSPAERQAAIRDLKVNAVLFVLVVVAIRIKKSIKKQARTILLMAALVPLTVLVEGQTLEYVGDVRNVIEGVVPNDLASQFISASNFYCAFEAGSPNGLESIGELVAFNGVAYAKSTDQSSSQYYQLISGTKFISTGVLILPFAAQAQWQLNTKFDPPISVSRLYEMLFEQVQQPFCLVGLVDFASLDATAITKAPIDGRNIFQHSDEFYSRGQQKGLPNVPSAFMGIATKFDHPLLTYVNKQLERVLYKNPFEKPGLINSHSHILTLKQPVTTLSEVEPSIGTDVLHVLSSSLLSNVQLAVYPVQKLQQFIAAAEAMTG